MNHGGYATIISLGEKLTGASESHAVLTDVKLGIIDPNEHVSQDPERTDGCREIDSHEATQTD